MKNLKISEYHSVGERCGVAQWLLMKDSKCLSTFTRLPQGWKSSIRCLQPAGKQPCHGLPLIACRMRTQRIFATRFFWPVTHVDGPLSPLMWPCSATLKPLFVFAADAHVENATMRSRLLRTRCNTGGLQGKHFVVMFPRRFVTKWWVGSDDMHVHIASGWNDAVALRICELVATVGHHGLLRDERHVSFFISTIYSLPDSPDCLGRPTFLLTHKNIHSLITRRSHRLEKTRLSYTRLIQKKLLSHELVQHF